MSSSPIKIGLIGLSAKGSWASRAHLGYLLKSPHYKIVALQNSTKASSLAAAEQYQLGDVACYDNISDLAADPNVDMVVVSVKVPEHGQLTEPPILASKSVFVEWPLGKSLAEAEHLAVLAREHNVKTMVGLQARQNPAIRKAKAMVDSGTLGAILGSTMNATGGILGATTTEEVEYTLPIENGANLVTIPAGHAMDALCWVLGEFASLQATLAVNRARTSVVDGEGREIRRVPKTSHDYMAVVGPLANGGVASVVYQGGASATGKSFYWEINGTAGSLVMEGPSGHVQMFQPSLKFVSGAPGAEMEDVACEVAEDFAHNVGSAYDAFVGVGEGSVTTFEDAVVRHRMIEAIYRSGREGTRETYKGTY